MADYDPKDIGKVKTPDIDPTNPYLKRFDQKQFSELSQGYEEGRISEGREGLEASVRKLAADHPELRKHLVPLLRAHRRR